MRYILLLELKLMTIKKKNKKNNLKNFFSSHFAFNYVPKLPKTFNFLTETQDNL